MMIMKKTLPILILLFIIPTSVYAWSGKVVGITDGDTIKVLSQEYIEVKIRLYGIDTPEKGQAYGQAATKYLSEYVAGESVEVQPMDTDRYGRTVAIIYQGDLNINEEMVRAGYAWGYMKYCKESFCDKWLGLEGDARETKQGLWKEPSPVPPWEWRRK